MKDFKQISEEIKKGFESLLLLAQYNKAFSKQIKTVMKWHKKK
jgi:hypothetical protein